MSRDMNSRSGILFIDSDVSDVDVLMAHVRKDIEYVLLSPARNAISQITEALQLRPSVRQVHIISHGRPGEISFSSGALCCDNITEYTSDFDQIAAALKGGDLFLWSCATAHGEDGLNFLQKLSQATGLKVSASTKLIGHSARGGCWDLDFTSGEVRSPLTAEGTLAYQGIMPNAFALTSITNDTGATTDFITSDSTLTISGTATTSGITYDIWLFGGIYGTSGLKIGSATSIAPNNNSTWSFNFEGTTLAEGTYTIQIYASGTTTTPLATRSLTIDTTAPTAPSITSVNDNFGTIQGIVTSGGSSNDTTPTVSISLAGTSAVAGDRLQLYNGTVALGTAVTLSSTNISNGYVDITTSALTNGTTYTFNAKITDIAGNVGDASANYTVTIDTTAPTVPSITSVTDDVAPITGTVTSGGSSNDTTPTVRVSLTSTSAATGDSVQLYNGTDALGTAVTLTSADISNGYVDITTATLSEGAYTFNAKITDIAGNTGAASANYTVTIDTTAPTAPSITSVNDNFAPITGTVTSGGSSNDTTPTIRVELNGRNANVEVAGDSLQLYNGTDALGTAVTLTSADITNGYVDITTATLSEGAYTFNAKITDIAGNTGAASKEYTVTIDTTAPPSLFSLGSTDTGTSSTDFITNETTLTLSGTTEYSASVNVYIDGSTTPLTTTTSDKDATWSLSTKAFNLTEGVHTLKVDTIDAAGNTSTTTQNVTIDTTAPTAPSITSVTDDVTPITGTVTSGGSSNDNTPTVRISLTNTSAATGDSLQLYNGAVALGTAVTLSSTNISNGYVDITTETLTNLTTYAFNAKITDIAGNVGAASANYTVTIDTTAPVAPVITEFFNTGVESDNITAANPFWVQGTSEADILIRLYEGDVLLGTATSDADGNWRISSGVLLVGSHTVIAKAIDLAGNESILSGPLTVVIDPNAPNTAPVVSAINIDVLHLEKPTASSLFAYSDFDTNDATEYEFWDDTRNGTADNDISGNWVVNGVDQGFNVLISITADQLADTYFKSGSGSDLVWVRAFDGQTWSDWVSWTVTAPIDTLPVAQATSSDVPAGHLEQLTLAPDFMFTVTDGDFDSMTKYDFWDSTSGATSGYFVVDGVIQSAGTHIYVSADQLGSSSTYFQARSGSDLVWVRAYDGIGWSEWVNWTITAPINFVPEAQAVSPDIFAGHLEKLTLAPMFTVTDGDTSEVITQYDFWDSTSDATSGYFVVDGVIQSAGTHIYVSADQLGSVDTYFQTRSGSDLVWVRAYDGIEWSEWVSWNISGINSAPVADVIYTNATENRNTILGASTLFSISDADSDSITAYELWDSTAGATSGYWVVGGVTQSVNTTISVSSSQIGNTSFVAGAVTDSVWVRAFDGIEWGEWVNWNINGVNHAPTIALTDVPAVSGDSISALSLFSVSDIDSDPITAYELWDSTAGATSGYWVVDGVTQSVNTTISVSSSQIGSTSFIAGAETDSLWVRAYDGIAWSDWVNWISNTVPLAPTITSFSPDSGLAGDKITNASSIIFTGTAEAGTTVKLYDGQDLIGTGVTGSTGAWSITTLAPLSEQLHSITATATNASNGASSASAGYDVTIDRTPKATPSITSVTDDVAPITGTVTSGGSSNDTTPTVRVSLTSTSAATGDSVQLYNGTDALGTAVTLTSADISNDYVDITTSALTNGTTYTFNAKITDIAGNLSDASSPYSITVDTVASAPIINSITTDSGVSGTDRITNDNTLMISGTAEANSTISVYLNGNNLLGETSANGDGIWSYDYTGTSLANGVQTFTARQTDIAGNISVLSANFVVTVDTVNPVLPVITAASQITGGVALSGTSEANSRVSIYDGNTLLGTATATAGGIWSYSATVSTTVQHHFNVAAVDTAGNNSGNNLNETIWGTTSVDALIGTNGNDTFYGLAGADVMTGLQGDDTYYIDSVDTITEGVNGGSDTVIAAISHTLQTNVENLILTGTTAINGTGNSLDNRITGNSGNNILIGFAGADTLNGGAGTDTVSYIDSSSSINVSLMTGIGSGGDAAGDVLSNIENVTGTNSADTIEGNSLANVLNAGSGIDTITYANATGGVTINLGTTSAQNTGGSGSDTVLGFENLTGSSFNDVLTGTSGVNYISGGSGNDTIRGGLEADVLSGGSGVDTFVYGSVSDSTVAARDMINNFVFGEDIINLSLIDANTAIKSNQTFLWGGNTANTVAYSVTWSVVGGDIIVRGDNTGNTTADFEIILAGVAGTSLTAGYFIL